MKREYEALLRKCVVLLSHKIEIFQAWISLTHCLLFKSIYMTKWQVWYYTVISDHLHMLFVRRFIAYNPMIYHFLQVIQNQYQVRQAKLFYQIISKILNYLEWDMVT